LIVGIRCQSIFALGFEIDWLNHKLHEERDANLARAF
jgi:hypothetical protein